MGITLHQVHLQLTDQAYGQARIRAAEAGFKTVDEYIADVVLDELASSSENLDHLFTPERLAHIDSVVATARAGGKTYSIEDASAELAAKREDWIQKNSQ